MLLMSRAFLASLEDGSPVFTKSSTRVILILQGVLRVSTGFLLRQARWLFLHRAEAMSFSVCVHGMVETSVSRVSRFSRVRLAKIWQSLWKSIHYSPTLTCISPRCGVILGDINICDPEEGRFIVWNQTFTDGDRGKTAVFHSFFPYVLEVAQPFYTRRDATALGDIRTLSRIDRIFINLPMAEARDFRCSS